MNFIKNIIITALQEYFAHNPIVQSKKNDYNQDVSFECDKTITTMEQTQLTDDEKVLLKKLGKDQDFVVIIDKLRLASCIKSIVSENMNDVSEARGFLKAFDYMKTLITEVKEKQSFNQVTGQPINQ